MRLGAALGLLLVLTTTHVAFGQASTTPTTQTSPANAKDAFRRGEAAYSAGNYDAAVREWTNAYAIDPRPRIQFNLSQAYERMGQLENAIDALKRFIDSGDPEDPTYSDASARLIALQQRLASTGVTVQGGPEGGAILVDGQDWGRTPRPDEITVKPGNHVIVVRWPAGNEFRTNVFVPAGQVVAITVTNDGSAAVQPTAAAAAGGTTAPPPSAHAETGKSRRLLWYTLGGGTAAAGAGLLIYGIMRGTATSKCGDRDSAGLQTYCNPKSEDAANRQSLAGYISGGVLLAGGATMIVIGALSGRSDKRSAKTTCGMGLSSASCTFHF